MGFTGLVGGVIALWRCFRGFCGGVIGASELFEGFMGFGGGMWQGLGCSRILQIIII